MANGVGVNSNTFTPVEIRASQDPSLYLVKGCTVASGQNLAIGTAVGIIASSNKVSAYASGNSDGTQVCVGVMERSCNASNSGIGAKNSDCISAYYAKANLVPATLTGFDSTARTTLKVRTLGDGTYLY